MYTIYDIDSFSKEEYLDFFTKLLIANYCKDIENILSQPDPSLNYSLVVEFSIILEGDVNFGPLFLAEPRKLLPIFNEGLLKAQQRILENNFENLQNNNTISAPNFRNVVHSSNQSIASSINHKQPNYTIKKNCRIRVCDLPICKEINSSSLPKSGDIGLFIEMRGTVIRTGQPKVLEKSKLFVCLKCGNQFDVNIDFEQFNQFAIPKKCPNPNGYCPGTVFSPTKGIGDHCDFQEIKLQEQIHQLGAGSIPKSILVLLQEDLVDSCQAGDEITVSGVVIRRWKQIKSDERCDIEVVVIANYIRVMNEQKFATSMTDEIRNQFEDYWIQHENCPLVGRNTILSHICPGVYGLFVVRLALLLVLIGGVNVQKIRGECHLLLVGEPGTGKSQFLKYAAKLASRSVITTGIGTTSAGLTASAVREPGGEMVLEAGALVLADGGVCCIDEFSGIKEADRATIHEAMEQQTLSVAKAGVISKLHTRTTIIAATNAKGKYDPSEPLSVNTNLASPLLSRFDIILLLTDDQNVEWDTLVSDFILKQSIFGNDQPMKTEFDQFWTLDMLQSYIYYVKAAFSPKLTKESKQLLEVYYARQRSLSNIKNEGRTTVRLLQSLIRLSQAHARLMFRNVVEVQDAIFAIYMIESSVESNVIITNLNAQHSLFPDDPDELYKNLEKRVKNSLGLSNISHRSFPRNRSVPKPTNHKTNDNWVNDNYDDDENENEDNDNENENYSDNDVENQGEEEENDPNENGVEYQEEEEVPPDWELFEEEQNQQQKKEEQEEFEYIIESQQPIQSNSKKSNKSQDHIIIEDTPIHVQNTPNIRTPLTQPPINSSNRTSGIKTPSNQNFKNSSNIEISTPIRQQPPSTPTQTKIDNIFNDFLFDDFNEDDNNNNNDHPMDISKENDEEEFQLSYPHDSQINQLKSNNSSVKSIPPTIIQNTNNSKSSTISSFTDTNKFTQENENIVELVDEILDDGMDWDDDDNTNMDPQPSASLKQSSLANSNVKSSTTIDNNDELDLEW